MKKYFTYYSFFIASLFFLSSCGSGEQSGEAESAETTEEVSAEETSGAMESFEVNIDASKVEWRGEIAGVKSHEGTVAIKSADVQIENGTISGGSFVVDLTSINPTDENYSDQGTAEMLVGHLSSADFFAIDSFPEATFTIESVEGNTAYGKLTVRGVTNDETIENINLFQDGETTEMVGTMTFDRMKYGVAFNNPAKDIIINDDIQLAFTLVAAN